MIITFMVQTFKFLFTQLRKFYLETSVDLCIVLLKKERHPLPTFYRTPQQVALWHWRWYSWSKDNFHHKDTSCWPLNHTYFPLVISPLLMVTIKSFPFLWIYHFKNVLKIEMHYVIFTDLKNNGIIFNYYHSVCSVYQESYHI